MKQVIAAAAVVATVHGASAPYEKAFQELSGCHLSFGSCFRNNTFGVEDFVEGFVPATESECEGETLIWFQQYETADDFEAAFVSSNETVKLVRLKTDVTAEAFEAELPATSEVDSYLFCDAGTYALVDGESAANLKEFEIPIPDKLKINPIVWAFSRGGTSEMIVTLAPHAAGTFEQISARLNARMIQGQQRFEVTPEAVMRIMPQGRSSGAKVNSVVLSVSNFDNEVEFIAGIPEVISVEPYVRSTVSNNEAALITLEGIENDATYAEDEDVFTAMPEKISLYGAGLNGKGQVVTVCDTGLDTEHHYFADSSFDEAKLTRDRIANPDSNNDNAAHRKVVQYVSFADAVEGTESGHGTHVAGTVAGSITPDLSQLCSNVTLGAIKVDGTQFTGVAPGAKIAVFDIGLVGQRFLNVPTDIADIFRPSYAKGVRIHTNSWGASISAYLGGSRGIDKFAYEHQDLLILFANSNDGPGLTTLSYQATSKNIVSVGAGQNSRRATAMFAKTRGDQYKCLSDRFEGGDNLDCSQSMAYFSSNGPTFDNRIKPDVAAPGYRITSAFSLAGNGTVPSPSCGLALKAGTSMATPVVAGDVAIVRQFFVDGYYPSGSPKAEDGFNPMAALLKAVLIDGTVIMQGITPKIISGPGGVEIGLEKNHSGLDGPSPYQGFGRVQLRNTLKIEGSAAEGVRNVWLKGDFNNMPTLTRSAPSQTFEFDVLATGEDMKATLVWYDPAASTVATKAIVNDLDVQIVDPSGKVFFPNGLGKADRLNTVEKVVIPASKLVEGTYKVIVSAHKLNIDKQPFAILVSGSFEQPSTAPTTAPTTANDDSAVSDAALWGGIIGGTIFSVIMIVAGIKYFKPVEEEEEEDVSSAKVQAANPKYDV